MGVVLTIDNASLDELIQAERSIANAILKKKKEIALAKSGYIAENQYVNVIDLELLTDPSDILFVKWYIKEVLNFGEGVIPTYIHKYTSESVTEVAYVFDECANSISLTSGRKLAIRIHEESIPYLMDDFREWCWKQ